MNPTIENHMSEIIALCKKYGVTRLEPFGSAMTGEFDLETSDFDFLVEYPEEFGLYGLRRAELREDLANILGRKVDLVIFHNIENPYVAHSIKNSRRVIYEV